MKWQDVKKFCVERPEILIGAGVAVVVFVAPEMLAAGLVGGTAAVIATRVLTKNREDKDSD